MGINVSMLGEAFNFINVYAFCNAVARRSVWGGV